MKLRFAKAYGFRSIKNVSDRLESKRKTGVVYDYIEIMACPVSDKTYYKCNITFYFQNIELGGGGKLETDALVVVA